MHIITLVERQGRTIRDVRAAAERLGVALTVVRWSDLSASVRPGDSRIRAGEVVLNDADAVLLRTMKAGTSEQIFFRMDVLHRLEASGLVVINPPRAIEISCDKYLSLALLSAAGLPTPETFACQKFGDAMHAFEVLGGDVVVKPLFGAEGFGITRISDPALAQRAFNQLERSGSVAYVQRFIPHHNRDHRLFVLGDRVLATMTRHGLDWRSNIALGGRGETAPMPAYARKKPEVEPGDEPGDEPGVGPGAMAELALRAARACGARIAGIDILVAEDGQPFVLEVNAIPGWKELAAVSNVDVAQHVLAYVAAEAEKRHVHA